MILKLRTADFSANNLGKVEVTTQLSDFTKAAILAGGRTDLNGVQKSAIDGFFKAIGAGESGATIASKMRYVFLPMLANDVANALINYKDDTFTKSATPSSSAWKLEDNGIAGVDSTGTGAIVMTLAQPVVQDNVCMFSMTSRLTTGTTTNQHYLSVRGKQNNSKWLTFYRVGNSFGSLPGQWFRVSDISITGSVFGYNLISSAVGYSIYKSNVHQTTLPSVDLSDQTSESIYTLGLSSKNTIPTTFMMLGDALTIDEMNSVVDVLDKLHDAFNLA